MRENPKSDKEATPVIKRSPQEIQERIKQLDKLSSFYSGIAYLDSSFYKKSGYAYRIKRELEWVLSGEEVWIEEDL